MVSVNCPICRDEIPGRDEQELSANLQNHMVARHELIEACDLSASDSTERVCKPSASGDLATLPYESRMDVEKFPPPSDRFLGEDVMQTVRCPICGETILGHTSEDLSFNVEAHMGSTHSVRYGRMRKAHPSN